MSRYAVVLPTSCVLLGFAGASIGCSQAVAKPVLERSVTKLVCSRTSTADEVCVDSATVRLGAKTISRGVTQLHGRSHLESAGKGAFTVVVADVASCTTPPAGSQTGPASIDTRWTTDILVVVHSGRLSCTLLSGKRDTIVLCRSGEIGPKGATGCVQTPEAQITVPAGKPFAQFVVNVAPANFVLHLRAKVEICAFSGTEVTANGKPDLLSPKQSFAIPAEPPVSGCSNPVTYQSVFGLQSSLLGIH